MHPRDSKQWASLLSHPSLLRFDENAQLAGRWWGADVMPLPLAKALVEMASLPGDLVLDPFGGVGTIGVAAESLGRRFAGYEIDHVRFGVGQENLSSIASWRNESLDESEAEMRRVDSLITSPPFGRKEGSHRVFDKAYFRKMSAVLTRASAIASDNAIAVVELMNWPEYDGGEELVFQFCDFMRRDWLFVREVVFINNSETKISNIACHTLLTFWIKRAIYE